MSWEVEVERGKGKLIRLLGWRTSKIKRRVLGQAYLGRKLNTETKKWELVPRNERKQGQFCGGGCKKDCKKSKEHPKIIFLSYWKSGSKENQTTFTRSIGDVVPVKQCKRLNQV